MTPSQGKTALVEGRYGEWFWQGLPEHYVSYLHDSNDTDIRRCIKCCCRMDKSFFRGSGRTYLPTCSICRDTQAFRSSQPVHWKHDAACRDAPDPEIFFLENIALYNRPDAKWREYCTGCPVRDPCRLYAIESKSQGIFGGQFFKGSSTKNSTNPTGSGKRGRPRKVAQ